MNAYQRLGEMLVSEGVITNLELTSALHAQMGSGQRLGAVLIERGQACEADVARCLAKQLDLELLDPARVTADPDTLRLISFEDAWKHGVVPFSTDDDQINVLVSDPLDIEASDALARKATKAIKLVVAPVSALRSMIEVWYGKVPSPKKRAVDPRAPAKFSGVVRRGADQSGTWFVATDHILNREVLLSATKVSCAQYESYIALLQWTAATKSELVATIFDTRIQSRRRWTAMEVARGESLSDLAERGYARWWGREILGAAASVAELLSQSPCGFLNSSNVFVRDRGFRIVPVSAPEPQRDIAAMREIMEKAAMASGADREYLLRVASEVGACINIQACANLLRDRANQQQFGGDTDSERNALLNGVEADTQNGSGFVGAIRRLVGKAA